MMKTPRILSIILACLDQNGAEIGQKMLAYATILCDVHATILAHLTRGVILIAISSRAESP